MSMTTIADYHHEIDLRMSERAFQAMVIKLAKWLKYTYIYHEYDSRKVSACGFPDLVFLRAYDPKKPMLPARAIYAELKKEKGIISDDQIVWLTTFSALGHECYLWRPRHWNDIVRILSSPERNPHDLLELP